VLVLDAHRMVSSVLQTTLRRAGLNAHELPVGGVGSILVAAAVHPVAVVLLEPLRCLDPARAHPGADALVAGLRAQGKRAVVLTERLDDPATAAVVAACVAAGADGLVDKSAPFDTLVQVLLAVAAGTPVMTDDARADWCSLDDRHQRRVEERAALLGRLTRREREVLLLMAAGLRASAIAAHFVVAVPTVRTQIRSILLKLEVSSQLAAVALVHATGSDPPPP
jgi:DNA-binding NarL/FixJ family response regulator